MSKGTGFISLRSKWDPAPPVSDGVCKGCWGWGFPIFPWRGSVAARPDLTCPDCGGSGVRP